MWKSCIFTADEERDFHKSFLGPTLQKAGLGNLKLMIWDHNRGLMYQRVQPAYEDSNGLAILKKNRGWTLPSDADITMVASARKCFGRPAGERQALADCLSPGFRALSMKP